MTFELMKRVITRGKELGRLDKEATQKKLDAFLAADRISVEEYQELTALMGGDA